MTAPSPEEATGGPTDPFAPARRTVNLLFAVLVAVSVAVAAAALWQSYTSAVDDVRRDAGNMARVLSEYLALRLSAVDAVLARLVATSRRAGGPDSSSRDWGDAIRTASGGARGLSALVVTNAAGIVTHSTILQNRGLDWSDRPIFVALKANHPNRLVAAPPMQVTAGDAVLIPIGRTLTGTQGEFIGTVIAILVPAQLREFLREFDLGPTGIAWIMLRSGEVLFRDSASTPEEETGPIAPPAFTREEGWAEDDYALAPLHDGEPVYLTVFWPSPTANLVVAVSVPRSDFLANASYEIAAVAVLLTGLVLLLFFARRRLFNQIQDAAAELDGAASPS